MKNIPTAEEFRIHKTIEYAKVCVDEKIMIEFARLHVEAALKSAAEKAKITSRLTWSDEFVDEVDKQSILNAYPLTNVK